MDTPSTSNRLSLIIAWGLTLCVSILPEVIIKEVLQTGVPDALFWVKIGLIALVFLAGWLHSPLKNLQKYTIVLFALFMLEYGASWFSGTYQWKHLFAKNDFITNLFSQQILRLVIALLLVGLLLLIQKRFSAFYLVKGDMSATAAPIPLLMSRPESWKKLALILALCISGGTLLFLVIGGSSPFSSFIKVLPLLPAILLLALMNSFSEEMSYRASLLSVLFVPLGKSQSLLLTGVFFGMAHYYGVPYGILGVIMASILGWFLGKSMLETRGFAWAWIIHFLQDLLIFTFMAAGSIVAGGR